MKNNSVFQLVEKAGYKELHSQTDDWQHTQKELAGRLAHRQPCQQSLPNSVHPGAARERLRELRVQLQGTAPTVRRLAGAISVTQPPQSTEYGIWNYLTLHQAVAHKDGVPPIGHVSIPGPVDPAVKEELIEGSPELRIDIRRVVSMRAPHFMNVAQRPTQ